MSGHTFFGERWYGFDDGLYAGARLLEILSRARRSVGACSTRCPTRCRRPSSTSPCAEGEHARADRASSRQTATFPGATDVIRIDGLRVEYPDGFGLARASNTTPVIVLRFEADDDGGARAHPGRVPRACSRVRSPASRCRSDA